MICLSFRRRTSRRWSTLLRLWKASTVNSSKRSLWTMTSRPPLTSSGSLSGKWRQKRTGCPSAGLIPEEHTREQENQTCGKKWRTMNSRIQFVVFIFGSRWWQGCFRVILTHVKWFICSWRTKVDARRFVYVWSCWMKLKWCNYARNVGKRLLV